MWHKKCVNGMTRTTAYLIKKNKNILFICDQCAGEFPFDAAMKKVDKLYEILTRQEEKMMMQSQLIEDIKVDLEKIATKRSRMRWKLLKKFKP
jgi:hypothetical protein